MSTPRARRRAETTRTLVSLARRATAAHGLHGYTIEELCDEAGVSRRTFFNYFASKEDAVLGIPLNADTSQADLRFIGERSPDTPAGEVSPSLIRDYAALVSARWAALEIDHAAATELMAAAEREPALIPHMLERGRRDQEKDIALIEVREGLHPGDPRAQVAVQVVTHLAHLALPVSLDPEHPQSFPDVLSRLLATAHDLFSTQSAPHTESTR